MGALTAYLFPGQGSQYVGMGRALYDGFPSAREIFAQADDILGISLSEICFQGPSDELDNTLNTQPAILATSVAALRALEQLGDGVPRADYVAGHSVGELSALIAAGALPFSSGLKLVRERGRLMCRAGEHHPGGMAAVIGLDGGVVETLCGLAGQRSGQYVGIANDNCPGQVVVSGARHALELMEELAKSEGARRVIRLAVSIAAHSPLMAEASAQFRQALDTTPISPVTIPLVANATARPVAEPEAVRTALGQQLTSRVRWTETVRWMISTGVSHVVEVGPGAVLSGLVRRIDPNVVRMNSEDILALKVGGGGTARRGPRHASPVVEEPGDGIT